MSTSKKIDGPEFLGPDEIIVPSCRDTKINIHEATYSWKIINLDSLKSRTKKGGYRNSPLFSSSDTDDECKWQLRLYPHGVESSLHTNCIIYLQLHSSGKHTTVYGEFRIFIQTVSELEIIGKRTAVKKFESGSLGWGFSMSVEDENKAKEDDIGINCEIKYSIGVANPFTNTVTESHLSEDLERLFKNGEFTDVVVSVKGKEYKAHKLILVARSPVFAAMFNHVDMKESQQNRIEITDFDESIVEEILNYIYAGKPKNLEKIADSLLIAAEKYGLDGLKDMSEMTLIENLSIENVVDMLIFADMHRAINLKSFCISFIVVNSVKVMKTDAWKNIAPSHPELIIEVCEGLSRNFCTPLNE